MYTPRNQKRCVTRHWCHSMPGTTFPFRLSCTFVRTLLPLFLDGAPMIRTNERVQPTAASERGRLVPLATRTRKHNDGTTGRVEFSVNVSVTRTVESTHELYIL